MTAAARPPRDGLSIGAVLTQLRPDFPDVTISKIRFLEAEGLISPARTESGYRRFTSVDVERLRFVLAAQRDHYLPLKVIREQLATADNAAEPSIDSSVDDRTVDRTGTDARPARSLVAVPRPAEPEPPIPTDARFTRAELVTTADIDTALFAELEQYGLLKPDATGYYDADAAAVAVTAKSMHDFGIEPRHLRAFRASADREVGLLSQIVAPLYKNRDPATRARADEMACELAALSVALHTLLVKAGLRAAAGG